MKNKKILLSTVFTGLLSTGLLCSFITNTKNKPTVSNTYQNETLKEASSFPIGVAINLKLLDSDSNYKNIVVTEFNSLTAEGAMKFNSIHPGQNTYNFKDADMLVAFAQAHHMRVHGHCLIWGDSLPDWVKNFQGSKEDWKNLMKTHIQTVVGHFKGKVTSWDVVNEAINYDGSYRGINDGTSNNSINIWAQHIGKEYIALAFNYAHQADPDALLFYNDYDQETNNKKLNGIIKMISDLKSTNTPIQGLGMQMHTNISVKQGDIEHAISALASTGLKIHISELDISANAKNQNNALYNNFTKGKQSALYYSVAHIYKTEVPTNQQYGITLWDVSDKDTWIRGYQHKMDWPTLFNESYQKKAIYQSFFQGLQ